MAAHLLQDSIEKEAFGVIVYEPLWQTMRMRGITTYALIKNYSFSRGTLDSLKQNRNISTATLNDLCRILSCNVEDILKYTPDERCIFTGRAGDS